MSFGFRRPGPLVTVKVVHTAAWLFFVGCIAAIPVAGAMREYVWAMVFSGTVAVECVVLALNGGRCPLTDLAGRYTEDRRDNFDIYLPVWLARYNKAIFGSLFLVSELYVLGVWTATRP